MLLNIVFESDYIEPLFAESSLSGFSDSCKQEESHWGRASGGSYQPVLPWGRDMRRGKTISR